MADFSDFDRVIARERDSGDELLATHANQVRDRMLSLGYFVDEPVGTDGLAPNTVASVIGLLHDFGKVAPPFQQYIRGGLPDPKPIRLSYHARLGAYATAAALQALGVEEDTQLAGWAAVLRHHGQLPNLAGRTVDTLTAELDSDGSHAWARRQATMIDQTTTCRSEANELLERATNGRVSWGAFFEQLESGALPDRLGDTVSGMGRGWDPAPKRIPDGTYDKMVRYWSALTLADKSAAGQIGMEALEPEPLSIDSIDRYLEDQQEQSHRNTEVAVREAMQGDVDPTDEASLNALREAGRQRVRANAAAVADHDVGLLTLPTGLGKTFSGLTGAFELADRLQTDRDRDSPPPIIYALPYTSIIEQTREIFEDEEIFNADPLGPTFTVHHYLSETMTYLDTERGEDGAPLGNVDYRRAELLAESWRSGAVLTTFVQLFESLAGPTNSEGLKLPALHDAVIILDEPQTLPLRWWPTIRRLSRLLIDTFDARIISMTATQPTLFTQGGFDTYSLLSGEQSASDETARSGSQGGLEEYAYDAAARVTYDVHSSVDQWLPGEDAQPIGYSEAASDIVESALQGAGQSVVSVCNTIASGQTLATAVEAAFDSRDASVTHLGAVCKSALQSLDTGGESLPDPEAVATRALQQLGFTETDDDSWVATDMAPDAVVGTFSSRFRPLDRRVLIQMADRLTTADHPFVFVSTQAIEAGVDISFAHAYRDIAPMDSIVQTAGRCNRSFEWGSEAGEVTIWTLAPVSEADPDSDADELPSKYIYEPRVLSYVAELLVSHRDATSDGSITATTFEREAVPDYFDFVAEGEYFDAELCQLVDDAEAETLGFESLIDQSYETVDVLVAVTDADRRRLEALMDALATGDRGAGFDRLKEFNDLRVSVPVSSFDDALRAHPRVDGRPPSDPEGVRVLAHFGSEDRARYQLEDGGFIGTEEGVSGQFTYS
ncbi:CRISPR-associated endonuclease Cas3'' [Halosegnis marinus]|uniref:CRISPR-associated endonuclease Cas3 n=1 Tax=Halosegnis marinus TaxID=3034023 RepID=A0ABD5ZTR7_9EURY|nr:CRISPR-associated endonuclease Cas3'' [Halosegnis sp. DT85]